MESAIEGAGECVENMHQVSAAPTTAADKAKMEFEMKFMSRDRLKQNNETFLAHDHGRLQTKFNCLPNRR